MGARTDKLKGKAKQIEGRLTGDRVREAQGAVEKAKGEVEGALTRAKTRIKSGISRGSARAEREVQRRTR